jgi:hypothetical protein
MCRIGDDAISVGIGTSSPDYKLHVKGDILADGGWLRVSGSNGLYFNTYGGGWHMTDSTWIRNYNNHPIYLYCGSSTAKVLCCDGRVGIGTTSPAAKLHVLHNTGTDPAGKHIIAAFDMTCDNGTTQDGYGASLKWGVNRGHGTGISTAGYMDCYIKSGAGTQGDRYAYDFRLRDDENILTIMTMQAFGARVGIGTDSPGAKLDVVGTVRIGDSADIVHHIPHALSVMNGPITSIYTSATAQTNFRSHIFMGTDTAGVYTGHGQNTYGGGWGISTDANSISNLGRNQNLYFSSWLTDGNSRYTKLIKFENDNIQSGNVINNLISSFTGQHRCFMEKVTDETLITYEGLIVSANKDRYINLNGSTLETGLKAISVSEAIPLVSISQIAKDKTCFGVISSVEDPETREERSGRIVSSFTKELGDTRIFVNSLGEGAIWVTNINGNLESGDYITTSSVAGYGMKQDTEFLANYTVAKITMGCDFNPMTQPIKQLKKEIIDVKYWVKTDYKSVSKEEYSNTEEENRKTITETVYTRDDDEITIEQYNNLEAVVQSTFSELTRIIYQKVSKEIYKDENNGGEMEIRKETTNFLDEYGQLQWEDVPSGATEKAYKIRYLDADGNITDETNAVHIAAFVGCTYHCG